jgi:hypothetical protein
MGFLNHNHEEKHMALMFQRLAHNFAKNGYYPTDTETTKRILNALSPCDSGTMRIVDPCSGEGVILAECKHHLGDRAISYGIEYNEERAWHGKQILDHCIHSDIHDCAMSARSFSAMILNPPYGDMVSDKSDFTAKRDRLEKMFYRMTNGLLQYGGIMVLIVPYYVLDKEYCTWIARHFSNVKAFMAPVQQFKQLVVFGVKQRVTDTDVGIRDRLLAIGKGDIQADELPEDWADEPYTIPAITPGEFKFHSVRLDARQLADVLNKQPSLWKQLSLVFRYDEVRHRPPLRQLSTWHLALALAAGQIFGVVKSADGRTYVIKGDTYKAKSVTEQVETNNKGIVTATVRTHTDRFVPTIRALDFTPDSATYGCCLTIQ